MRRALLLPVFFVTYSLAYMDRANYGFGAAAGMAKTLGITEGRSALLGALFFLGYFAFQIPGMLVARRFSATRVVFAALLVWGALAALTGAIRTFAWLAIDRLLLGVAESIVFPAMLLLLTRWFTRAERSRANTILILGNPVTVLWMSAITGFLIQRFGWQRTFIVEGVPAMLWAFVWIAIVRDEPSRARWLATGATAELDTEFLAEDAASVPANAAQPGLRAALLGPDVLLLAVQYFCWSLGVYGFVLWLPTIVRRGTLLSMGQTGLLSAVPYLAAIFCMVIVGYASDRTLKRQEFVWPCLLLAGSAMLGSFLVANRSFVLAFVCLIAAGAAMYAPYGPFFAIIPERVPRQFAGEAFAMINSCGALGGFVGIYLVGLLQAVTGSQRAGYLLMSLALILSALLLFLLPKKANSIPVSELTHG